MKQDTVIAQVNESTEQIMKDISENITSSIADKLQEIKDDTDAIEDITSKLSDFDSLSTSLKELKEIAEASKMLSEKVPPMGEQLTGIQSSVGTNNHKIESLHKVLTGETQEEPMSITCRLEKIEKQINENANDLKDLKESIAKVHVTLAIIVNLTTPFWKKWGKSVE